jgi:hypothetical protein
LPHPKDHYIAYIVTALSPTSRELKRTVFHRCSLFSRDKKALSFL